MPASPWPSSHLVFITSHDGGGGVPRPRKVQSPAQSSRGNSCTHRSLGDLCIIEPREAVEEEQGCMGKLCTILLFFCEPKTAFKKVLHFWGHLGGSVG